MEPPPQLDLQAFINAGLLADLANRYDTEVAARALLAQIGFPRADIPAWPPTHNARQFWTPVCNQIDLGLVAGGLLTLLEAAVQTYPGWTNALRFLQPPQPAPPAAPCAEGHIHLYVRGQHDPLAVMTRVLGAAARRGIPTNNLALGFANEQGILFRFTGTMAQALELTRDLEQGDGHLHTRVGQSDHPEYLYHILNVVGPDQARLEVRDIPASTTVGELARGVLTKEYDPKAFGADDQGRPRPTVVERLAEDGSTQRLNGNQSLQHQGIQDGDTLTVNPESRAGAVAPEVRQTALLRARSQILGYQERHTGFRVGLLPPTECPTEYVFRFRAPSFAPPPGTGEPPRTIDDHDVFLSLPGDFPVLAPEAFWLTPIFHPNIWPDPARAKVCLGLLEERYRPSLDFGYLCQMLVEIAAYRNYVVHEGYNREALKWAVSTEGQLAIEARGGCSITRMMLQDEFRPEPPPLRIRRL